MCINWDEIFKSWEPSQKNSSQVIDKGEIENLKIIFLKIINFELKHEPEVSFMGLDTRSLMAECQITENHLFEIAHEQLSEHCNVWEAHQDDDKKTAYEMPLVIKGKEFFKYFKVIFNLEKKYISDHDKIKELGIRFHELKVLKRVK